MDEGCDRVCEEMSHIPTGKGRTLEAEQAFAAFGGSSLKMRFSSYRFFMDGLPRSRARIESIWV